MDARWIAEADWIRIQQQIPIACVDVLLTRASGLEMQVGLIRRETPHQGPRWCLIGGRLLMNEPFEAAIEREVRSALGAHMAVRCVSPPPQPLFVAEYFSVQREGRLFDPRKHALGMIFEAQIEGAARPQGEALDFAWFDRSRLPGAEAFGFEQDRLVRRCLDIIDSKNGAR